MLLLYMYQFCLFFAFFLLLVLQQACFDILLFKNSMSLFLLPLLIFSGQRKMLLDLAFKQ